MQVFKTKRVLPILILTLFLVVNVSTMVQAAPPTGVTFNVTLLGSPSGWKHFRIDKDGGVHFIGQPFTNDVIGTINGVLEGIQNVNLTGDFSNGGNPATFNGDIHAWGKITTDGGVSYQIQVYITITFGKMSGIFTIKGGGGLIVGIVEEGNFGEPAVLSGTWYQH